MIGEELAAAGGDASVIDGFRLEEEGVSGDMQAVQGEAALPNAPILGGLDPAEPSGFGMEQFMADPAAADAMLVDTRMRLQVPGVFHSIHNSVAELNKAMGNYNHFCKQLRLVCDLLRRTYSHQRLMETCFSDPPASCHKELYSGFSSSVQGGRWGSVAKAVIDIGPLEASLTNAWDAMKFNRGRPIPEANGDGVENPFRLDLRTLDNAIRSRYFWAYRAMLELISDMVTHLLHYIGGCKCHRGAEAYQA